MAPVKYISPYNLFIQMLHKSVFLDIFIGFQLILQEFCLKVASYYPVDSKKPFWSSGEKTTSVLVDFIYI